MSAITIANSLLQRHSIASMRDGVSRRRRKSAPDGQIAQVDAEPLWTPISEVQRMALETQADELFFGGSAGGGKSDLLLGAAMTQHMRSIIFRRESTQLTGLVDRSKEIVGTRGRFTGAPSFIWRNLPGGRQIQFAGCKDAGNEKRFQGRARDLTGFDELSEFLLSMYLFLTGWNRTTIENQRVRTIATGNPPTTAEGMWVIVRWAPWLDDTHPNPAVPGELRWFAMIDDEDTEVDGPEPFTHKGELLVPKSRTFIPATVDDNPFYLKTGYKATLMSLPEPLRSQMLYGNFKAGVEDNAYQVIPTAWIRLAQQRGLALRDEDKGVITSAGGDVARGGRDKSIIATVRGGNKVELFERKGSETPDGKSYLKFCLDTLGPSIDYPLNIDVIGIGASAYDDAKEHYGPDVHGVSFATASKTRDKSGKLRLANLRAVAFWRLREALDPESGADICLPVDNELVADLTSPRYEVRPGSVIYIESKDEIKTRLHRSTDKGDAVALALMFNEKIYHSEPSGKGLPSDTVRSKTSASSNPQEFRPDEIPMDSQGRFIPSFQNTASRYRRR